MFLPFYAYQGKEFRPVVDDWDFLEFIPSTVLAIAAFICELRVRLNRASLGLAICAAFLVIWPPSYIMASPSSDLGVGSFFYLAGGLLLLWASATIWVNRRRASRTTYLIRWPYVLVGSVLLLVPYIWRMRLAATLPSSTSTWLFRLYLTSIVIAAALTVIPKHITDARRDASLTAFMALAVTQLAILISWLLSFHDLYLLKDGWTLVELASAVCVWIVLLRAQQTATQGITSSSP
jgi:hypothetical protein